MEMELDAIKALIPHREPFLFLDSISEIDDDHVVALRTIKGDEPQFQGHYPGNPIMPGVLLCEATFQAAAVFLTHRKGVDALGPTTPVLARIQDARFKKMVKPGDQIEITVKYNETIGQFHFLEGVIRKDGKVATTIKFALAMVKEA